MITRDPINIQKFFDFQTPSAAGALASFIGTVRNHDRGRAVERLLYESYETMAEKMIGSLIDAARGRWPIEEARVLHRVGTLEVGEAAVAIGVWSAHRAEAFEACRFLIEEIKEKVPIWKKEFYADGTSHWTAPCR